MKNNLRDILLFICISSVITVILDEQEKNSDFLSEDNESFIKVFTNCLGKKIHGTFECVNRGSLSVLQSLNDVDNLDYGCIKLARSDGIDERNLLDLDYDPQDFGNVVKAAARLMERRNLKWDLGNMYPGLLMRVGPMLNGNGILEFAIDERAAKYSDRQLGTGRMLMRSLVLPFLLGFKFSLSSLIPLIFGVILIVTKKALLLTKIALLLSGILGWNSFVTSPGVGDFGYFGNPNVPFGQYQHHHGFDNNNHHSNYAYGPYNTLDRNSNFRYNNNQHVIREIVNVYDPETDNGQQKIESSRSGKNFLWST